MSKHSKIIAIVTILLVSTVVMAAKPVEQPAPPDDMIYGGEWLDPDAIKIPLTEPVFTTTSRSMYEFEGNFYMSQFNDGWISMVTVFVWKMASMRGWGSYALVISPENKRYFSRYQFDEKKVVVAGDHLFFKEGDNMIEGKGDGIYRIKLKYPGFACDLTYKNNVPPWRPGNGYAYYEANKKSYGYNIITSPWADVSGSITLPDKSLTVNGEGYSDWGRGSSFPTKLSPYLYSIRTFSPPGTPREDRWMFGLLETQLNPSFGNKRMPYLHLAHNNKIVLATKFYNIEPTGWKKGADTPYDYPTRFRITARDKGWVLDGEYVTGELFDFLDVLQQLPPWFKSTAEKFVKRPVYFRSRGTFNATVTSPDGKKTTLKLIGPHEYVVTK